jgi:hypothetical protein
MEMEEVSESLRQSMLAVSSTCRRFLAAMLLALPETVRFRSVL